MTSEDTVIVTDGDQRAALALVRSLGRAGYRVFTCSSRMRCLAGASRYCQGEARIADPLADPIGFVRDLVNLVRAWKANFLIPLSEAALLSILPAGEQFASVRIPFADAASFRRVSDKELVLATAPRYGIGVPEQWILDRRHALPSITDRIHFPLVVKPSRSIRESAGPRAKLSVRYAEDLAQLEARLAEFDDAAFPILLQRRVRGPGVGVFLLLWEGRTLAVFSHRRIREKPPSGGVSVYRESIPSDPSLVERSRSLLQHFGWNGVAMVEYKLDQATGTPYLMEINGRFWGSLQLAIDAGVDFPVLLLAAAAGKNPAPVLRYQTGIRSRWWWGDVDHLLACFHRSANGSGYAPDVPSRWRALRDFLVPWRPGDRSEVLQLDDPRPFIRETVQWFRPQ